MKPDPLVLISRVLEQPAYKDLICEGPREGVFYTFYQVRLVDTCRSRLILDPQDLPLLLALAQEHLF